MGKKHVDWLTIEPNARFDKWMPLYRFKEFRQFLPSIFKDVSKKDQDPWWKFSSAVKLFNDLRASYVMPSNNLCMDELMCAFRPRKTKTGGLPNITNIPRKPEPLGTEFKCMTCTATNVMLHLEVQRGKDGMKESRYHRELGATAACTVRLSEEW